LYSILCFDGNVLGGALKYRIDANRASLHTKGLVWWSINVLCFDGSSLVLELQCRTQCGRIVYATSTEFRLCLILLTVTYMLVLDSTSSGKLLLGYLHSELPPRRVKFFGPSQSFSLLTHHSRAMGKTDNNCTSSKRGWHQSKITLTPCFFANYSMHWSRCSCTLLVLPTWSPAQPACHTGSGRLVHGSEASYSCGAGQVLRGLEYMGLDARQHRQSDADMMLQVI